MPLTVTSGAELLRGFDEIESRRDYARVELAERRLSRLVASPSGFFRGAPGFFYWLVGQHRGARRLLGRDRRWIVGDVHLENVGVIEIGRRKLVFEFNDLDEAIVASPMADVLRGAASAALGAQDLGFGSRASLHAAEAFIVSYIRPLAEAPPQAVTALVDRATKRTVAQLLDERCPGGKGGTRQFTLGKRYMPLVDDEPAVTRDLFARYAKKAPLDWVRKTLRLEDAAFRVQGTGSLGVRRFIFLAREGKRGEQMLLEAKEMRKSALVRGRLVDVRAGKSGEAGRVARGIDALLSAPQGGVRALRGIDGRSYLMRLHAPGEDKLALASLANEDELVALAKMIGYRLSQAHERAAGRVPPGFDPTHALSVAMDLASVMHRAQLELVMRASLRSGA